MSEKDIEKNIMTPFCILFYTVSNRFSIVHTTKGRKIENLIGRNEKLEVVWEEDESKKKHLVANKDNNVIRRPKNSVKERKKKTGTSPVSVM